MCFLKSQNDWCYGKRFSLVCKSWFSFVQRYEVSGAPWLMLAQYDQDSENRRFMSLINGDTYWQRIPATAGKRCMETLGWVDISLVHPFSFPIVEIHLPHQNTSEGYETEQSHYKFTFIHKPVLSSSPCLDDSYILMVIAGKSNYLSPGNPLWTRIWDNTPRRYSDLVFLNHDFYAVDYNGGIFLCCIDPNELPKTQKVAQVDPECRGDQYYLAESMGSLFVVLRLGVAMRDARQFPDGTSDMVDMIILDDELEDQTYGTTDIIVFEVDVSLGTITRTWDLGDRAFFIGHSASRSIQASLFPQFRRNRIYFTDDYWPSYINYLGGGGSDMGAFNLADGTFHQFLEPFLFSEFSPFNLGNTNSISPSVAR